MNRFINEEYPWEQREADARDLNLPAWKASLWDGIHFWAAGLGRDLMKKHVAGLLKRWGKIPPQAEAVCLVERTVHRAIAAERQRIRHELLEAQFIVEVPAGPGCVAGLDVIPRAALDRICPAEKAPWMPAVIEARKET